MVEKKYIVKPESKVVIARDIKPHLFVYELSSKASGLLVDVFKAIYPHSNDTFVISPQFGKAKCDEEDEWNEMIGCGIARDKCDIKTHDAMIRKYKIMKRYIAKADKEIDGLIAWHEKKIEKLQANLKKVR